ncbi:hypothetical protein [Streptomyces bottropensis]|uniref:hypothetical protein n=1 Tax=Streptomyces TaxID=1883 RepID=UPI000361A17E|nr:hypothetical protein [Streptomyces bottropensis]MZD16793.1 hypothetical protein [Streptomyces sp. SID5476]
MTDIQVLFLGFGSVAAAFLAVVGSQLAPAEGTGVVTPKSRWNWAGRAALATVVNLGMLFHALELGGGTPSGARIGGVGIGVMCAAFVALLAYILHRDEARGPRCQKTGAAFTAAMLVLTVVTGVLA